MINLTANCAWNLNQYLQKCKNLLDKIWKLRDDFENLSTLNNDKDYKILEQLIKKHKGANCRELVELMKYKLTAQGIDCNLIGMDVLAKDRSKQRMASDHLFLAVNIKKDAKFENPATWGSKAIIVDPWAQAVSYASEGIENMKINFRLDESNEYFKFYRTI